MSGHVSVQDAKERQVAPDTAHRKRAQRRGRERGCWVYIDAEQLTRAGINPLAEPPYYRCNGYKRSRNGHTAIVSLYQEP